MAMKLCEVRGALCIGWEVNIKWPGRANLLPKDDRYITIQRILQVFSSVVGDFAIGTNRYF